MRLSRDTAGVLLILVVAAAIRLPNLGRRPLWTDEQFSITQAMGAARIDPLSAAPTFTPADLWKLGGFEQIVSAAARQDSGNGILYQVTLRGWLMAFGFGDGRVRVLSVLGGLATIAVAFFFARALLGTKVAFLAASLCALHPLLFNLDREARPYTFATASSLAASWLLFRLLFRPAPGPAQLRLWIGYGLLAAASLLLHYLTIAVFGVHALLAALFLRGRGSWLRAGLASAIAAGIFGTWMALWGYRGMESIRAQQAGYQLDLADVAPDNNYALPTTPHYLGAGLTQALLPVHGNFLQMAGARLGQLVLLLGVPLGLMWLAWRGARAGEQRRVLLGLVLLSLSGPALALVAALKAGHIVPFQPRYSNFSSPYSMMVIAAAFVVALDRPWLRRMRAGLAAIFLIIEVASLLIIARYDYLPPSQPHARLAQEVLARYRPDQIVTFQSWKTARLVNLYLPRAAAIRERVVPGPEEFAMTIEPAP